MMNIWENLCFVGYKMFLIWVKIEGVNWGDMLTHFKVLLFLGDETFSAEP